MVALVRDEPSGAASCPADVASLPNSSQATAGCTARGGSASVLVDMGDVCTEERSKLYLWVAIKGAQTVSAPVAAGSSRNAAQHDVFQFAHMHH